MWSPLWTSHPPHLWNWEEHHLSTPLKVLKSLLARKLWKRTMSWHFLPESPITAGAVFTSSVPCWHLIRFFEFKAMFGGNLVCGFGRLYGQLTGFLVNSGPITAGDSQKGGHFVQVKTRELLCTKQQLYPLSFVTTETSPWFSFKMGANPSDPPAMEWQWKNEPSLSTVNQ